VIINCTGCGLPSYVNPVIAERMPNARDIYVDNAAAAFDVFIIGDVCSLPR